MRACLFIGLFLALTSSTNAHDLNDSSPPFENFAVIRENDRDVVGVIGLDGHTTTTECYRQVCNFHKLSVLSLSLDGVKSPDVASLAHLPLTKLSISDLRTPCGLVGELARVGTLKTLSLDSVVLDPLEINSLNKMSLRALSLAHIYAGKECWDRLVLPESIEYLDICDESINDSQLKRLIDHRNLIKLSLVWCRKLNGSFFSALPETLEELEIRDCPSVDLQRLGEMRSHKQLRKVALWSVLKPASFSAAINKLSMFENVRSIEMASLGVSDRDLRAFNSPFRLESVTVISRMETVGTCMRGWDVSKIRQLNIDGAEVDFSLLRDAPRFNSLLNLRAPRAEVSESGVKALAELRHLRNLDLSQTLLNDKGLLFLANKQSIRLIDASRSLVTVAGAERAASARGDLCIRVNNQVFGDKSVYTRLLIENAFRWAFTEPELAFAVW